MIKLIHHKAALDTSPHSPNSLARVRDCLAAGVDMIEIDIRALARENFVLLHDDVLEKETTGHGPIFQAAPADIELIEMKRAGEERRVAFLTEVVRLLEGTSTRVQLDFKDVYPYPDDEPLRRLVRIIEPVRDHIIVSCCADWQLRILRRLAPWLELGFDPLFYLDAARPDHKVQYPPFRLGAYGFYDDHLLALEKRWPTDVYLADRCATLIRLVPNVSTLYVNYQLLVQSLAAGFNWGAALHEEGIQLAAWTVDATLDNIGGVLDKLGECGVNFITSNTPLALRKLTEVSISKNIG